VPATEHLILNSLVDIPIQILVVEADPILRSGVLTCLHQFPDLRGATAAETRSSALLVLSERIETTTAIDLVLFGLFLDPSSRELSAIDFCQQVKTINPNLPILLLTAPQDPNLQGLLAIGIEGCCVRGTSIVDLVESIRQVAAGKTMWAPEILQQLSHSDAPRVTNTGSLGDTAANRLRHRLRWRSLHFVESTSLQQIDTALAQLNNDLADPQISPLEQLILTGRRRELNAARWLVKRVLATSQPQIEPTVQPPDSTKWRLLLGQTLRYRQRNLQSPLKSGELTTTTTDAITPKAVRAGIFDRITAKLQFNLENLTPTPLEIDLLRLDKKRELYYLILRQFEGLLDELRFSQVTVDRLPEQQSLIWQDLWASVTTDFFGRYYNVSANDLQREIVPTLLQDRQIVQTEILAKIPQTIELLNYFLFQMPLTIDNISYAAHTQTAADRAGDLLENFTIHLANAVIQPLLNYFGNSDEIKFRFFDRRLLSTREIERFRNDLSWRYRLDRYFSDPQAIFESKYHLFIFTNYGIKRITIYAPRTQELERLTGIPLTVTLALETRDAIVPRLQSAATIIGSVVVYLLTEVIGRGIGLIGRGVIKGVGNIWQERNYNHKE
jgi:DNA-binding NarL/FixJ family response regulator